MVKEIFFDDGEFIVSKTDLHGKITYGNALFIKISGYKECELLGAPHNILRHPSMPKIIFKLLWKQIQSQKEIFAYVKNKTKNGDFYWVLAQITPSYDDSGNTIGYHSVRRKPKKAALDLIAPLYSSLLEAENNGGMEASNRLLENKLKKMEKTYDQFVLSI